MVSATCCESVSFQRPLKSVTRAVSTRVTLVSLAHPATENMATPINSDDNTCRPAIERRTYPIAISFILVRARVRVNHGTTSTRLICYPFYLLPFPGARTNDRRSFAQNRGPDPSVPWPEPIALLRRPD